MTEDRQNGRTERPDPERRRQRRKNLALAGLLVLFALLIYFVAIVRMSSGG